jgi:hypothetical protein
MRHAATACIDLAERQRFDRPARRADLQPVLGGPPEERSIEQVEERPAAHVTRVTRRGVQSPADRL